MASDAAKRLYRDLQYSYGATSSSESLNNPDAIGEAIYLACQNKEETALQNILDLSQQKNLNWRDNKGRTPFFCCVEKGFISGARRLLDAGANINAPNKKNCHPLTIALNNSERSDFNDFLELFSGHETIVTAADKAKLQRLDNGGESSRLLTGGKLSDKLCPATAIYDLSTKLTAGNSANFAKLINNAPNIEQLIEIYHTFQKHPGMALNKASNRLMRVNCLFSEPKCYSDVKEKFIENLQLQCRRLVAQSQPPETTLKKLEGTIFSKEHFIHGVGKRNEVKEFRSKQFELKDTTERPVSD